MNKAQSSPHPGTEPNFHFKLMSLTYRFRDFFQPRTKILEEAGIQPGSHVLDYGCGPGSYVAPLVELVGPSGKIYALDTHPLAIRMVKKLAARKKFATVTTIHSSCQTALPDQSIDVALLYDVFHDLGQPGMVLRELHRVLKPGGILSFSDHHLREQEIVSGVTKEGFFRIAKKGQKTYSFQRID